MSGSGQILVMSSKILFRLWSDFGQVVAILRRLLYTSGFVRIPHFVWNVHDEWQGEAVGHLADEVGILGVKAIVEAGKHFNLNCPLDGEYNVGDNWAETH